MSLERHEYKGFTGTRRGTEVSLGGYRGVHGDMGGDWGVPEVRWAWGCASEGAQRLGGG